MPRDAMGRDEAVAWFEGRYGPIRIDDHGPPPYCWPSPDTRFALGGDGAPAPLFWGSSADDCYARLVEFCSRQHCEMRALHGPRCVVQCEDCVDVDEWRTPSEEGKNG